VAPQIVKKARLVKKEVEPIFSTADEMKSAPKTAGELSALLFVTWSYSTLLSFPKYDAVLSLGDCFVVYLLTIGHRWHHLWTLALKF